MNKKAVALFSGGLDSMLAVKLMLEQGVEIRALNFLTIFCTCTSKGCMHQATKAARELNVPLNVMNVTEEYMEIVKNPKYGRGSNMNPCIDCRIFGFKKAKIFMEEIGASFIVTGEVLGERPMSQTKNAISLIERKSGLEGFIVRPLSAKLFEPTIPEKLGVVDRDRLLDIQGRRRDKQFALAKRFGITSFPNPAGGCLLTDKAFSNRLKDLLNYNSNYDVTDLHLLKIGRQFRIREFAKLFVGRNEEENRLLLSFSSPGDYIFDVVDTPSPIGLVRGSIGEDQIHLISSILARYSDGKSLPATVSYRVLPEKKSRFLKVNPAPEPLISSIRI